VDKITILWLINPIFNNVFLWGGTHMISVTVNEVTCLMSRNPPCHIQHNIIFNDLQPIWILQRSGLEGMKLNIYFKMGETILRWRWTKSLNQSFNLLTCQSVLVLQCKSSFNNFRTNSAISRVFLAEIYINLLLEILWEFRR
jgi:hypothetical protein